MLNRTPQNHMKRVSNKAKIANLRKTYENAIGEQNRKRDMIGKSNDYEIMIYINRSVYQVAKKAFTGLDKRIVAVLPDIPTEVFAFRFQVPNIVGEVLKKCQRYLDLYRIPKTQRVEYIRRLIKKLSVENMAVATWLIRFMEWYNSSAYLPTSAGHREIQIQILEPIKG